MTTLTHRGAAFRSAIASFIAGRQEAKLKSRAGDAGLASKYGYEFWLADAARRVGQIQAVTHVLKATHPEARGSSLHVTPDSLPAHAEIGTHLLGNQYAEDVVGNAAALDVFKFLKIQVDGKRLIEWMQAEDADLHAALSDNPDHASEWMKAFAALVRTNVQPSTHPLAKQIYWLVGADPQLDDEYHLLQPMFSSSLAHAVHEDIQEARFGEANKAARQAFRSKSAFAAPYSDYRNLVARKLGGTKPQNVSQLNSDRRGVNYLLSSLPPPTWQQRGRQLLKRETALDDFQWFEDVRKRVRALSDYLHSVRDIPSNLVIREERDLQVRGIAEQFALFGATIRARYPAGWTRAEECVLPRCEQLWLDPERADLLPREDIEHPERQADDEDFEAAYHWGDWPDQVATRFGNWLNARLRDRDLPLMAEPEMRHWARQLVLEVAWPIPLQRRAVRGEA